jgi:indole-3-glycerol phosphate synthase
MCSNFSVVVFGQFPPTSYIISDSGLYSEKFTILAKKILRSSGLLIGLALMQNDLSRSPYPKGRF